MGDTEPKSPFDPDVNWPLDPNVNYEWSDENVRKLFDPNGYRTRLGPFAPLELDLNVVGALSEEALEILRRTSNREAAIQHFFGDALFPYYGYGRLLGDTVSCLHVVYRLADFLPPEERQTMPLFPQSDKEDYDYGGHPASLVINGAPWYTLEDWRSDWEQMHPVIPEIAFQDRLPFQAVLEETSP